MCTEAVPGVPWFILNGVSLNIPPTTQNRMSFEQWKNLLDPIVAPRRNNSGIVSSCTTTVETFKFCTSRPIVHVCQCLVVQIPIDNMSKYQRSTPMTHVACKSKLRSLVRCHPCIDAQETVWKSGFRSCIMPGLTTHVVQELNVGTVSNPFSA